MNQWDKIWKNRMINFQKSNDIFQMFCELKSADGFDTQDIPGYYEAFFKQWEEMADRVFQKCSNKIESVYEVGCGSGVNLFLFQQLKNIRRVGGVDYSDPLVELAGNILGEKSDLKCEEALNLDIESKYGLVLADSVFQYFQDADYGLQVLEKMWNKSTDMIVITEIHDRAKREEHLACRRRYVENYDEKYKGLDKTFYEKQMFLEFSKNKNAKCEIVQPQNNIYWNNEFVFDCYLFR